MNIQAERKKDVDRDIGLENEVMLKSFNGRFGNLDLLSSKTPDTFNLELYEINDDDNPKEAHEVPDPRWTDEQTSIKLLQAVSSIKAVSGSTSSNNEEEVDKFVPLRPLQGYLVECGFSEDRAQRIVSRSWILW